VDTTGFWVARRTKRLWTDEEKLSICFQTAAAGVSVARVARRYAMNANLIFKWLRDPRFALEPEPEVADAPSFLPVEIVDRVACEEEQLVDGGPTADGTIEIDITGGHPQPAR